MRQLLSITLLLYAISLPAQPLARIIVHAGESDRTDCPLGIPLDRIDYNLDEGDLMMTEVTGNQSLAVPCQLEPGHTATLWFILQGTTPAGTSREFLIEHGKATPPSETIRLQKRQGQVRLVKAGHPVLDYQFLTLYPPEGIDPLFKKSAFIHPLWSPGGEILTRIQPPDHYHHYGIWGPWTKTHINGREVDFWNLARGQGTVRFSGFLAQTEGPVYSGYKILQDHIDFGGPGEDRIALREVLDIRVWNTRNDHAWLIDYTSTLNTPLDSGIVLDAYRYGGGIGFRATEKWQKDNSSVLTSEHHDRLTADGTKARWCLLEGASDVSEGRSGILFMGYPANREFPEPMRVWPVDANGGRGDLFFEFCPIRHNDWVIKHGQELALRYRMLVFDGSLSPEDAEATWRDFGDPPVVEINRITSNKP
ncbi:MAG: DUF6807 domain-containing protein [Bacteroidales bacterium]